MSQMLTAHVLESPVAIADYLDKYFGNWRNGPGNADYILYTIPGTDHHYMIGTDPTPGFLVIDGERFYSAAWL